MTINDALQMLMYRWANAWMAQGIFPLQPLRPQCSENYNAFVFSGGNSLSPLFARSASKVYARYEVHTIL